MSLPGQRDRKPEPPSTEASSLDRWIRAVQSWAANRQDVIGVLLVGSQARGTATQSSDIDFAILADDIRPYVLNHGWAQAFGEVEREESEDWGRVQSLRVWYVGGPEIEWGLTTADWIAEPLDPGTRAVLQAGYRLVHDRNGSLTAQLASFGLDRA